MALADILRERVSRRGRTAQVDCGALGTVTVEALSPRECAALGMADGGRALLYAACRELQAAGETLRRERRLFTPDEVTQYVIYRFEGKEPINLEDPSHIVAITRQTFLRLPYAQGQTEYTYVVTALDRLQNESKGAKKKVKL